MSKKKIIFVVIFLLAFSGRIVYFLYESQIKNHEKYVYLAERQQKKTFPTVAERGIIKDRNGEVLVFTKDEISFYVDKRMLRKKQSDTLYKTLSKVFNKSKLYYKNLVEKGNGNILLEKKAPKEKAILLSDFIINGFIKNEDYTRVYPYGNMAGHLLGYVDTKFKGAEGLEKQLNKELKGEDGLLTIECDVFGRMLSVNEDLSKKAIAGSTVFLTINKTYQKILEEEIVSGINQFGGKSAVGIIMDPNTGEILALANYPMFNPNDYNLADNESRKNRAITDPYEPGSTIKPVVMSVLLEENKVRENEYVKTFNGTYGIHGVKIRDTHEYSSLTVREVIENSSNIGMAVLSDRIDKETFYKYLRDFGFGNQTLIELPSESGGLLKRPERFGKTTKMFMSFGYELMVTPIQLVSAYSALINGGTLYQPKVIAKIIDSENNVKKFEPVKLREVISEKTSNKIKSFMQGVVENGTGNNAKISRVSVGGKTGTTQRLVENSYSKSDYLTSFVGFFPVDNPKIVCYVMVNSPTKQKYGGSVAAPIFNKVAERIIDIDTELKPNFSIKSVNVIKKEIKANKFDKNITKYGNLKETKNKDYNVKKIKKENGMPDLTNLSLREAIAVLSELGIKYKASGSGKVVTQSIPVGAKINSNLVCEVVCVSNKKVGTN